MQNNNQAQLSLENFLPQDQERIQSAQVLKSCDIQMGNVQTTSSFNHNCQNDSFQQSLKLSKQNFSWSKEEDGYLREKVETKLGKNQKISWKSISNQLNQQFHDGMTVRDRLKTRQRFFNCLDPCLKKGNWTEVEDYLIVLKKSQGMQWCKIRSYIQGRNDHQVKNRFYFLLKQFSNNNQYCTKIFKTQLQISDFSQYVSTYLNNEQNDKLNQILKQVEKRKNHCKENTSVISTQVQQTCETLQTLITQGQQTQTQPIQVQVAQEQNCQEQKRSAFVAYDAQYKQWLAQMQAEKTKALKNFNQNQQIQYCQTIQNQQSINNSNMTNQYMSQTLIPQSQFIPNNFFGVKEFA